MHARARVYVVQRGGDRRGWMILTKKRFLFLHRRVSRFATPLYGIYFYIGKKYSRNREWGREGARTRDGTGHGVWSAGSRWTESGGDHDHEGGNARNGAERENKGKERERERERERGGERERWKNGCRSVYEGRRWRLLFSFFSARARGDFSIFPASPPSRVPTFRRGFSGISLRGRKQKGRRSVKSNSANVQPRRRFTLLAENSFALWKKN